MERKQKIIIATLFFLVVSGAIYFGVEKYLSTTHLQESNMASPSLRNDSDFLQAESYHKEKKYSEALSLFRSLLEKMNTSSSVQGYLLIRIAQEEYLSADTIEMKQKAINDLKELSENERYEKITRAQAVDQLLSLYYADSSFVRPLIFSESGHDNYQRFNADSINQTFININAFGYSLYPLPMLAIDEAFNRIIVFENNGNTRTTPLPEDIIQVARDAMDILERSFAKIKADGFLGGDNTALLLTNKAKLLVRLKAHGTFISDPIVAYDEAIDYARSINKKDGIAYGLYLRSIYRNYSLEKNESNINRTKSDLDEMASLINENKGLQTFFINDLASTPNQVRVRDDFSALSQNFKESLEKK